MSAPGQDAIQLRGHQPLLFTGQKGKILELLLRNKGEWVPAYELARLALQYNARLFTIRREGYRVESKTERISGQVHGSFRLVACPGEDQQLSLTASSSPEGSVA